MKIKYITATAILFASTVSADVPRNKREFRVLNPINVSLETITPPIKHEKEKILPAKDPSRVYYGPTSGLFPNIPDSIEKGFPNFHLKMKKMSKDDE